MTGWMDLADAPLSELGLVWSPSMPDRTDITGRVIGYPDGSREVSATAGSLDFTKWHPLPAPPTAIWAMNRRLNRDQTYGEWLSERAK